MPTFEDTEKLVKERIKGFRKGTNDVPTYLHSFHVRDLLKEYGFNETVQMAGLLHDIVEDGDTTFDELKALGYSDEVISLVDLATHDMEINDSFERWKNMMSRLEKADNKDAWAIKLADVTDNVNECHLMPNLGKKKRFLYEKCPYFVKQGNKYFGGTEFYQKFLDRYLKQMFRLLEWKNDKCFDGGDDNEMIYWVDEGIYYKFPNKITEQNKHEVECFDAYGDYFFDFSGETADEIADYCFESIRWFGHEISDFAYNVEREEFVKKIKNKS